MGERFMRRPIQSARKTAATGALAFATALSLGGCLEGHKDQDASETAAAGHLTVVSYDTATAVLNAQGQVKYPNVTDLTVVQFHANSSCSDVPIGQGVEKDFLAAGITVRVPSAGSSSVYVAAVGLPGCHLLAVYTPSYVAPPPATLVSTIPASPSRVSSTPAIIGQVANFASTVSLYRDAACTSLLVTGTASSFTTTGFAVALTPNQTTSIYSRVSEPFGAASACTSLTTYTHTTSGPAAPALTSVAPASPTNVSTTPVLTGTLDATTVKITLFKDTACSTALISDTAANFKGTGTSITVAQNAATPVYAIAYDAANAPSVCTYLTTFVHDSIGPVAPTFTAAAPATPTNASIYPRLTGLASGDTAFVKFYKGVACVNQIGMGTKADFEGTGIIAGITANATTAIYAAAFDAAGNQSSCVPMLSYVHNTIAPDPPVYDSTLPATPTNGSTSPLVLGFTAPEAVAVKLFNEMTCTTEIGSGTASDFASPGIVATATANATTPIYGQAIDVEGNRSVCTLLVDYMHSNNPAPAPGFLTSNPPSPSNTTYTPAIVGTAVSTISAVRLYGNAICTAPLATGTRSQFTTAGLTVTVSNNYVTTIYAISTDIYGNTSPCTFLTNYIYDTKLPFNPAFTSFTPLSPNNTSSTPIAKGVITVDAFNVLPVTKVTLFDSSFCLNNVGTGTPTTFQTTGITLNLPTNATSNIYAKAYDAAGNFSACTYMADYTHDALPPGAPVFVSTLPASPSYTRPTIVSGTYASSPDFLAKSAIVIYSDATCQTQLATAAPTVFTSGGIPITAIRNATTNIYAATFDIVGNFSACTHLTDYDHSDLGPASLTATQNLDGTVSLVWQPDLIANPTPKYVVQRALRVGGPYSVIEWANAGNSYTDTSITNNASYYYVVAATNNTGTSKNSAEASLNVSIGTPTGVGTTPPLTAIPGYGEIILSWSGFNDDATYKVYRATQSGGPYTLMKSGLASKTYTDTTTTNGTAYYYVVRGVNPAGDSQQSNEANGVPLNTPNAPVNLKLAVAASTPACGGGSGVMLTWTAPLYYNSFNVRRSQTSGGSKNTIGSTITNSYTDCAPYSYYYSSEYYDVVATWGSDKSVGSNEVAFENQTPAGLTVYPGNTTNSLYWSPVNNANAYTVLRSDKSGGPYTAIMPGLTGLSYTDPGRTNGAAYYYIIKATFANGADTYVSNEASGTPRVDPTAPANLVILTDASRAAHLYWSPPAYYDFFRVYTSTSLGGTYVLAAAGNLVTTTNFLDTGAAVGLTYYKVVAVWGGTETAATNIVSYRHGYPTIVTPTPSASGISISWSPVAGASSYEIYRSFTSGTGATLLTTTTTTYVDSPLAAGTGYFYTMRANFADGTKGEMSAEVSAMPTGTNVPSGLSVTATTQTSVTLTWATVKSTSIYKIYKSTTATGTYTLVGTSSTPVATVSAGLSALSTYYFKVTATVATVESAKSNYVTAVTNGATGALTLVSRNAAVAVSWNGVLGATSYTLGRSTDAVTFTQVGGTLQLSDLPYVDSPVTNGQIYFYRYTAYYAGGVTIDSPISTPITPGLVPGVPAGLTLTGNPSSTSLTITWGAVSAASNYNVYVSTTSGSYGAATQTYTGTPTTLTGLTTGTTYYVKVSALIGDVESGLSSELSAVPIATPAAPYSVTAHGLNTKLKVDWNAVGFATSYDLESSVDQVNFTPAATGLAGTTYTDAAVVTGLSYTYRIKAYKGSILIGTSPQSAPPASPGTQPGAPLQLSGETINASTVSLNWAQSADAVLYNLYRGTSAGTYAYIGFATPPASTYLDATAAAGTTYYYVVRAESSSGVESVDSNMVTIATTAAPGGLVATPGGNAITLTWTNTGAASYLLRRGIAAGGPYGTISSGSNATSFSDTNVQNGVTYYYVVNSVTAGGAISQDSAEANAVAAVRMNLEVPIELTDMGLASNLGAIKFARTTTSLDTSAYDGTVTYRFEVVALNADTAPANVTLVNSANATVGTIAVPAGTNTPTRITTVITPTGTDTYQLQLAGTASAQQLQVLSGRIVVKQVGASKTKIYIPLLAANAAPSAADDLSPIYQTMLSAYSGTNNFPIWRRNSSAFSQLADANAWSLETVVSSPGGDEGIVGLFDQTSGAIVTDSETIFSDALPVLTRADFSEGIAGFSTANDGEDFMIGLRCRTVCSAGGLSLHKAGLWVKIAALGNVEVLFRGSLGGTVNTVSYVDNERSRINLANFSNPTAYFQATASISGSGSSTLSLYTLGATDSGYAGAAGISGSTLNFLGLTPSRSRSAAVTLTSGDRFLPGGNPGTATGLNVIDAGIVINTHK